MRKILIGLILLQTSFSIFAQIERNKTDLILPFNGEWTVVWGGDSEKFNYHIKNKAQKNAFDFIITDKYGKSFKTDRNKNENFYAFGKKIIAPCNGMIISVIDGIKDNKPSELNPYYAPGNSIILKTENNEFLYFAHLKQNSIKVKQGQKIIKGEILGLCGNSGNSTEPHLHFHIQNQENINNAIGIKCYFEKIIVSDTLKTDYSPIKKEKIRNEK
ncbi:M23 family metallopeptidase [Lutibacter sp. B1]|uniref:M23 family metallopeptidase n=1 Tax=Lutibacter sp. B1 TaxID=2725996 RepID=UPI001456BD76|nr:M23 family metallopeptidase [Lutibacter sp. B1]NLP59340.1 M23 family metallopeptidase [Lutibacter sp. B1]